MVCVRVHTYGRSVCNTRGEFTTCIYMYMHCVYTLGQQGGRGWYAVHTDSRRKELVCACIDSRKEEFGMCA